MSALLDLIEKRGASSRDELQSCEMPEWGCKVYFRKMSFRERAKIWKDSPDTHELIFRNVLYRSLNQNGERLFKDLDRLRLEVAEWADIERLGLAMFNTEKSAEEVEKNSQATTA